MEVDENFNDESHILYVNSKNQEDTELGRLMHDLHCKNADDMYSEILANRVRELKETQEGVDIMCREMDKIYNDGKAEGREEGRIEGRAEGIEVGEIKAKKETALSMAERGMSLETISQIIKISENVIKKWINENMSLV